MTHKKMINGVLVDWTPEEEQAYIDGQAQRDIDAQAEIDARATRQAKLASGKAKLKELGLDDDELQQILGI